MKVHAPHRSAPAIASAPAHAHRPDIDGLRAVAVIPVVLFHAKVHPFDGGFVGVDIFFVISGYLIMTILMGDLRAGRLSIAQFYQRRIRRIFPALFVMAAGCVAAASYAFPPSDFAHFGASLVAMSFFASNIYFDATHQAAGYFDAAAQTQVLLHTWSLAVEEQFYIFLPIGLLLMRRCDETTILRVLSGIALLSFAFAVWAVGHWPTDAFYNVASRAWELLLGSLLAVKAPPALTARAPREAVATLGLGLIAVAIFCFSERTPFPGVAAVLPCLGAVLVIHSGASGSTWVSRALSSRAPVAIGLISYSLYLWHWPILVIVRYLNDGGMLAASTITAIVLSLVAAVLSYRFVETPFRRGAPALTRWTIIGSGLGASLAACLLGVVVVATQGLPGRFDADGLKMMAANLEREADHSDACLNSHVMHSAKDVVFCAIGKSEPKKILVWGDSHAEGLRPLVQRLYDGNALDGRSALFATSGGCPPSPVLNRTNNAQCDLFSRWSLARAEADDVETVVIYFAAWWDRYSGVLCRSHDGTCREKLTTIEAEDAFVDSLRSSITELEHAGKRVILGLPAPYYSLSIPRMEINALTMPLLDRVLRQTGMVHLERNDYARLRRKVQALAQTLDLTIFDPRESLCKGSDCRYANDGVSLYVDNDHLASGGVTILHDSLLAALRAGSRERVVAAQ